MNDQMMFLSAERRHELLDALRSRFESNAKRHQSISWNEVEKRLQEHDGKLWSLDQMETTGGEPDVIGRNPSTGEFVFCDCSAESPLGRRNLCYDHAALDSRKKNKPQGSAIETAEAMGIDLLTEQEYRTLQELVEVDMKTSSWIVTPPSIRERGGALFCDRRYGHVFVYHNGAESYYAARGFRGLLRV